MAKHRRIATHSGHELSFREAKFIEYVLAGKAEREAVVMAGYRCSDVGKMAKILIGKEYIAAELEYRFQKAKEANIADATEILSYYTDVMRGVIKDQFGLDAPLSERTKAANELAKRLIDYEREAELSRETANVSLTLNWDREEKENDVDEQ